MKGAAGLVRVSDWARLPVLKVELVNDRSIWARQSKRLGSSS